MAETAIGKITHFYSQLNVGIIALTAPLSTGATIHIKGHTTDFTQKADSLQLDHQDVNQAKKGDQVGVKLDQKVRHGDTVNLVN